MKNIKVPVEVNVEYAYCEKCGEELIRDNMTYMSNPVQFKYTCPNCKHIEMSNELYPRISFQDKNGRVIK